jgi:hypothetical protein
VIAAEFDPVTEDGRPLVVIDPESDADVERFCRAYTEAAPNSVPWLQRRTADKDSVVRDVRNALRSLANPTPPKPDEPTGLGAVVEDSDGHRWVRVDRKEGLSSCWQPCNRAISQPQWSRYEHIAAVRVLSEGVTA